VVLTIPSVLGAEDWWYAVSPVKTTAGSLSFSQ
jgi:hypothetical protein